MFVSVALGLVAMTIASALFFALPRDASTASKVFAFVASGVAMAAFCVACAACRGGEQRWLARLARWCFALYLVNMPVLHAFALIGFGQSLSPSSSVLRFFAWALASVAVAALVHYLVERPMLEWGQRRIKPSGGAASSR